MIAPERHEAVKARLMQLAVAQALAEGDYTPLMTRTQRRAWHAMTERKARLFVLDCSRRWGKTVFLVMLMFVSALAGPNRIIRYIAPTKLHGRQFVLPTVRWLSEQLPEEQRPRFNTQDNTWIWPNGSVCHLGSAETMGDVEAMVGTECHRALLDEAGKIHTDLLRHLHRSVLRAQLLTTGGDIVVGSTPALNPSHYLSELVELAERDGACVRFTIDDCDHVSVDEREAMIAELGGRKATDVRRELYCERVTESTRAVVPEFIDAEEHIVRERPVPRWVHWYVVGDLGFEDLSVVLFAWYDFARATIVVHDEIAMQYASGLEVGRAVKAKEAEIGINDAVRVADGTLQLLADLADRVSGPGVEFGMPPKDDAEAALNALRMEVARHKLEISPRCTTLIRHLRNAIWTERRNTYERSAKDGHWDAVDAAKYLVRIVDRKRNPVPRLFPEHDNHRYFVPPEVRDEMARAKRAMRF